MERQPEKLQIGPLTLNQEELGFLPQLFHVCKEDFEPAHVSAPRQGGIISIYCGQSQAEEACTLTVHGERGGTMQNTKWHKLGP